MPYFPEYLEVDIYRSIPEIYKYKSKIILDQKKTKKTFGQISRHFRQFGATLFFSIFHQKGTGVQNLVLSNHDPHLVELVQKSLNKSIKNFQKKTKKL